ncbi:hypothetical protein AB0C93_37245 [Streptomyces sp. NPDC048518]|uniref:hypothetical protein n=1 Tax=Streptomyces sp. NPDC048518 TaxID=3155029 RepID=UPI003406F597
MSEEASPPHSARPRRRALAAAVAAGLVAGALAGLAAHRWWPGDNDGPKPSAAAPAVSRAQSVRSAMLAQRLVAVDVHARELGATASFHGQARLDLVDAGTAKAATHVAYDGGEGHPWYPPQVVLIGNRAAITPHQAVAGAGSGPGGGYRTEPDATAAAEANPDLHAALETRWLAQPAHIEALLNGATAVHTEQAHGTRTLTGNTPLPALAADPAIGALYRPYAADRPHDTVHFTLTITTRDLPKSLKTRVPSAADTATGNESFQVNYHDWAKGHPITARPAPPPQWTTTN